MEGCQGGEKGREEAEVRLGGGWPTAPRDATLPSLGVWGEPGTALPVLGKSGPVPAYVWAREPVSRWPFAVLVSGFVRSLRHLAGPEQLPWVALRLSTGELAALGTLFRGGLGGFLENKIFVALPTGFKCYLRRLLNQDPFPKEPKHRVLMLNHCLVLPGACAHLCQAAARSLSPGSTECESAQYRPWGHHDALNQPGFRPPKRRASGEATKGL